MRSAALILGLAMAAPAQAVEVFEVGTNETEVLGDEAYKLNKFVVNETRTLNRFSHWLDPDQEPFALRFTVYRATGANTYELIWESEAIEVAGGAGWKQSPELDLDLVAGETFLIGIYLTVDDMVYFYGDAGGDLGWADNTGLVSAENDTINNGIPLDVINDTTSEDLAYLQQVALADQIDVDGDGFPPGEDCDDNKAQVHPGHPEWCDSLDNDCNGTVDDNVITVSWYADVDGDGYGDTSEMESDCLGGVAPDGTVTEGGDCDDADPNIRPGADEVCDGVDQDCDGTIDDGIPGVELFRDADGDSFGDPVAPPVESCLGVYPGYVDDSTDCDDLSALVFPGAEEQCNGEDDDCDGVPGEDEGDADGDGLLTCDDCDDDSTVPCAGNIPAEFDDEAIVLGTCGGCNGGAPAGSGFVWALAGLAALRRRRS